MGSDQSYAEYVIDQIKTSGSVTYRKMFGEYMVYVNAKPIVLICDNIPYVKIHDSIKHLTQNAEKGFPYKGAREHYIANADDSELLSEIVNILEQHTEVPKKKKKKI